MARYQQGLDAEAFEGIVSRFLAPALAVAQQMLSDRALAEDAVQETFLRLVRRRQVYCASRPFAGWFYAVLRNVCRDMGRHRRRRARVERELAAQGATGVAEPSVGTVDVRDLLATLPPPARAVLELRVVQGLSFGEVAAALGISEEAAKKRAQRALRRLRQQFVLPELPERVPLRGQAASLAGRQPRD